jgi:hypothetical protein
LITCPIYVTPFGSFPGDIISVCVSCRCAVSVSCFVLCSVDLLKYSLPVLASRLSTHIVTRSPTFTPSPGCNFIDTILHRFYLFAPKKISERQNSTDKKKLILIVCMEGKFTWDATECYAFMGFD